MKTVQSSPAEEFFKRVAASGTLAERSATCLRPRGARARQGGSATGPTLRIGRTRRCAPTKTGGINPDPTSNAVFQARGEEAEGAFGALRHRPLLPAQPDEHLQILQRVEVTALRQQPQRQARLLDLFLCLREHRRGAPRNAVEQRWHHLAQPDQIVPTVRRGPQHDVGVRGEDRKSTRLNSSHSQISYAV